LDPKQRLLDFFNHFERLLEDQRNAELAADYRASQGIPKVPFSVMLKQAARTYTPKIYEIFEIEYGKFLNCVIHKTGVIGDLNEYTVIGGYDDRNKECVVQYDFSKNHIICSCQTFEFIGIQGCHALKDFDVLNIKVLPDKYYLKRWRRMLKMELMWYHKKVVK
jgi:zinc finger SWIM domain-containing protein 3